MNILIVQSKSADEFKVITLKVETNDDAMPEVIQAMLEASDGEYKRLQEFMAAWDDAAKAKRRQGG